MLFDLFVCCDLVDFVCLSRCLCFSACCVYVLSVFALFSVFLHLFSYVVCGLLRAFPMCLYGFLTVLHCCLIFVGLCSYAYLKVSYDFERLFCKMFLRF